MVFEKSYITMAGASGDSWIKESIETHPFGSSSYQQTLYDSDGNAINYDENKFYKLTTAYNKDYGFAGIKHTDGYHVAYWADSPNSETHYYANVFALAPIDGKLTLRQFYVGWSGYDNIRLLNLYGFKLRIFNKTVLYLNQNASISSTSDINLYKGSLGNYLYDVNGNRVSLDTSKRYTIVGYYGNDIYYSARFDLILTSQYGLMMVNYIGIYSYVAGISAIAIIIE